MPWKWSIDHGTLIMISPIPRSEPVRLAVLHAVDILDTPPDRRFDALVELAARICQKPMADLSLVDESRQWFKARLGIAEQETPRDISFCQHTIMGERPIVVQDAIYDPRFSDSPLVRKAGVRFYAGAPVNVMGENVGALCVLDTQPGELHSGQVHALRVLAELASWLIHESFFERNGGEDDTPFPEES